MTITSTFITKLNRLQAPHKSKQVFSHWLPYGVDGHVTTKISRMRGYSNFLAHGFPLESSAIRVLTRI